MKKYYQVVSGEETADIYIYGDITSWPWLDNDVSAAPLVREIDSLEAGTVNVYINSYGGEVAEALAIASALTRCSAAVTTYCDGFACSAAADIFMASDRRIMSPASLLMIHNAWTCAAGNADELRKAADDIETISRTTTELYRGKVNISDDELQALFDAETWITPEEAVRMGFATGIAQEDSKDSAAQSARRTLMQRVLRNPVAPAEQEIVFDAKEFGRFVRSLVAEPSAAPQAPAEEKAGPKQYLMALLNTRRETNHA